MPDRRPQPPSGWRRRRLCRPLSFPLSCQYGSATNKCRSAQLLGGELMNRMRCRGLVLAGLLASATAVPAVAREAGGGWGGGGYFGGGGGGGGVFLNGCEGL